MEIFLALFIISASLLIFYFKYQQSYFKRRDIPHEVPHFMLGNLKDLSKTKHFTDLFDPVYKKFKGIGPFAGFYFLWKPAVVATDLEFVKQVLIKDFNNFDERGVFHNERDDPLTGNLFSLDGVKWRALRQKLSPTFTSGKMKMMFPTVLKVGEEFERVFEEKVDSAGAQGVLKITDLVGLFTADVIGECAFGLECNSLRNPDAEFVKMGRRVLVERRHNIIIDNFIQSFPNLARKLRLCQTAKSVEDFYLGITRNTVQFREQHGVKRADFMNLLIEMKNGKEELSFNELAAQAFIFFVAGFETSSTTLGFALYELAKNVQVQDRLREEINAVFKRHNEEFTYECMQDQQYLQQVVQETLRKYPVLPFLMRKSNARYETADPKYYIEEGMTVVIPVHAIHHDPAIYPEPAKFDPDRFTDAEVLKRPACSWLPFGDGPRNCVGLRFGKMQVDVGLTYLIRNFRFNVCAQTPKTIDFFKPNPLLSSTNGIELHVTKV